MAFTVGIGKLLGQLFLTIEGEKVEIWVSHWQS